MSGSNIGNYGGFGTQDPQASSVQSGSVSGTEQAGSQSSVYGKSSIEKSEVEAVILLMSAGFPMLAPPQSVATSLHDLSSSSVSALSNVAATNISMVMEQTKNDIISSMWDSFQKNVREMADRSKKEDIQKWTQDVNKNGPKSSAEYYAFLMTLSSHQRAQEINGDGNALAAQFNQTYNTWLVNPSAKIDGTDPTGYPSSAFIAGSVAANPEAVRDAIGAVGTGVGYQLSVSPVADALYAVGPTSGLPMDSQAAAALVSAMLNGGAAFKGARDSITQAAGSGQPIRDLDFALNYAKNIMNIVTHNVESGGALSGDQIAQNKMMRVMLAAMALVLIYRTAYEGISAPEFSSMLDSKSNSTLPEEIRSSVQQLAIQLNNNLPSDPAAKTATLARLENYATSNASVDSMLATTRLFSGLLKTSDISNKKLSADGV